MMSRISAEFESSELAEMALKRVKESVSHVFRTGMIYNKKTDSASKLSHGTLYTVIPTAVTSFNYITAVVESPASEDVVIEPQRNITAKAFVICDAANTANVSAIFNSMGGLKIRCNI